MGWLILIVLLLIVLILLLSCVKIVPQATAMVVERCQHAGRRNRVYIYTAMQQEQKMTEIL